jgi:phage/plasmid-associated DNA primase
MANVDADVSADVIMNNTGILKKLTGNDLHTGEYKYKRPFKFTNYAKLFFSCNKIPETEDDTDAFFRRLIIISLKTQFFGEKEDFDLIQKLTTDEELTLLLHELLPRVPHILRYGLRQTTNESIEANYDKYTKGSNLVKAFFEKAVAPSIGSKVRKVDLQEHFDKFCRAFGLTPKSDQSFSRKLTEHFHLKYDRFREKDGERTYYWLDVRLVDWAAVEEERERNLKLVEWSDEQKEVLR